MPSVTIRRFSCRRVTITPGTIPTYLLGAVVTAATAQGMPRRAAVDYAAGRGCRLEHLDTSGVPFEGHVLVVRRLNQHPVTDLGKRTFAHIFMEENFLVDEAKVVLNLGDVTSSAKDTLIRIKLGRILATHLRRRLGLRLVLESYRIDRP